MHPYLPHLLADINAAWRTEIQVENKRPLTFEEEMEELEKWEEEEEPPHTFGYYCGLESINFPPAEQLTEADMKTVLEALRNMLFSWNLATSFPQNLPIPIAYKMTVEILDSKTTIFETGRINFDFCSGYAPDCVFKEYCSCLEIWNEAEAEADQNIDRRDDNVNDDPDTLPF